MCVSSEGEHLSSQLISDIIPLFHQQQPGPAQGFFLIKDSCFVFFPATVATISCIEFKLPLYHTSKKISVW